MCVCALFVYARVSEPLLAEAIELYMQAVMMDMSKKFKLNPQFREDFEHEVRRFSCTWSAAAIYIYIYMQYSRQVYRHMRYFMLRMLYQAWAMIEAGLHRALFSYCCNRWNKNKGVRWAVGASAYASKKCTCMRHDFKLYTGRKRLVRG